MNKCIYIIILLLNNTLNLNSKINCENNNIDIEKFLNQTQYFYDNSNLINKKDVKKIEKKLNNLKKLLIEKLNEDNENLKNKNIIDIINSEKILLELNNFNKIFNKNKNICKKIENLEKSNKRYTFLKNTSILTLSFFSLISILKIKDSVNGTNETSHIKAKDIIIGIPISSFFSLFFYGKSNDKKNEINKLNFEINKIFEDFRNIKNIIEEIESIEKLYNKFLIYDKKI